MEKVAKNYYSKQTIFIIVCSPGLEVKFHIFLIVDNLFFLFPEIVPLYFVAPGGLFGGFRVVLAYLFLF